MELSKITAEDPGKVYPIGDTDAKVRIRKLKPYQLRELRRKHTKYSTSNGVRSSHLDLDALNDALVQACVVDWENITDDGAPVPVTEANKKLLNDNWSEFNDAFNAALLDGQKENDLREEILEGN